MARSGEGRAEHLSERTGGACVSKGAQATTHAWTAGQRDLANEERGQDERDGRQQLDQHVKRRPCRVLEGVADRVTHDACLVRVSALAEHVAGGILEMSELDVLLGVVPRAAR